MKFEKVTEAEYRRFWEENGDPIESEHQRETRVAYFKDELPLPKRSTGCSAGYDFVLPVDVYIKAGEEAVIPTGIKVQLDEDKQLDVLPRSSYGIGKKLIECTTVGIVDADYYNNIENDGHILVYFWNRGKKDVMLPKGDRFVQGIIRQYFVVEGDEYGKGPKRVGGSGSTGEKALPEFEPLPGQEITAPVEDVKEEAPIPVNLDVDVNVDTEEASERMEAIISTLTDSKDSKVFYIKGEGETKPTSETDKGSKNERRRGQHHNNK